MLNPSSGGHRPPLQPSRPVPSLSFSLLALAFFFLSASLALPAANPDRVSFARDIAPVLADRCTRCHGDETIKGRYRVDSFRALTEPGDTGKKPIVAGDPQTSHLFSLLVTDDADDRMPQNSERLDPATLDLFRRWIQEGANFDGANPAQSLAELTGSSTFPAPPLVYAFPVPIAAVAFLPADRVAVGGFREITLWTREGILERRIPNVPERIQALALHPDGQQLFFAGGTPGRSGAAGVVDLSTNSQPRIFLHSPDTLLALACSPDGSRVAVAGTERGIAVFTTKDLARVLTLSGHSDWVLDLAFSADGRLLASASRDRTSRVFDSADGSLVTAFRDHTDAVQTVAFVDGTNRVATAGKDGRVRTWNASTGKDAKASKSMDAEVTRIRVTGDTLWTASTDGRLREWRISDLSQARDLGQVGDRLLGLACTPTPETLAATTYNGQVGLWDASTGTEKARFTASPLKASSPSVPAK